MSLKIAVLSSLPALGAFRAPAQAGDQTQNSEPVGFLGPLPRTDSHSGGAAESKKPEAGGAAESKKPKPGGVVSRRPQNR